MDDPNPPYLSQVAGVEEQKVAAKKQTMLDQAARASTLAEKKVKTEHIDSNPNPNPNPNWKVKKQTAKEELEKEVKRKVAQKASLSIRK